MCTFVIERLRQVLDVYSWVFDRLGQVCLTDWGRCV